jgi:hypothetical protein
MAVTPDEFASGSGTSGSVNITTLQDGAFIFGFPFAGGWPITVGANYTEIDPSDPLFDTTFQQRKGMYDLDAGVAGIKAVDFTQSSSIWQIGAVSFSHSTPTSLLTYTGFGGVEANSAADIAATLATDFDYTGAGGVEANSAATIVDATPTDFTYTGAGGVEADSEATVVFLVTDNPGIASFEPMTSTGAGEAGTAAVGRGYFEAMTAEGTGLVPFVGFGVGIFEVLTGIGYGPTVGEASFEPMTATGQATQGGVGVASFKPLEVIRVEGAASFMPLAAVGYGQAIVTDDYTTKVINLRTGAVTEFSNHEYNSFARIGTKYYGAGPTGLVRLDGTTDPSNTNINWHVKTGQMDGKDPGLKRLPEVMLGLRSNNKITVRIHPDDNTSHNYQLPVVQKTTIHQHRVQPGKGMRSRWYAVALLGSNNATLELDSMQVNMTKTTRRLG